MQHKIEQFSSLNDPDIFTKMLDFVEKSQREKDTVLLAKESQSEMGCIFRLPEYINTFIPIYNEDHVYKMIENCINNLFEVIIIYKNELLQLDFYKIENILHNNKPYYPSDIYVFNYVAPKRSWIFEY